MAGRTGATAVRVTTFNIRNGLAFDGLNSWWFRRRATARLLADIDADVAGLQEVYRFQERWLGRTVTGYEHVSTGRHADGGGERCPVWLRRARLRLGSATTRWFSDESDRPGSRLDGASFPRIATLVKVTDVTSGLAFGVANVHLDERRRVNRMESVRLLLSWLDTKVAWIVLGDFNAASGDPELGAMEAAGYRSVLKPDAPGTAHNFTGTRDGRRIDHILFQAGKWAVVEAEVVTGSGTGRLPSDHWPVAATLTPRT